MPWEQGTRPRMPDFLTSPGASGPTPPKAARREVDYDQDIIRPSKGKFSNVLNTRSNDGWKVEDISQVGENFLVTYSRQVAFTEVVKHQTTVSCGGTELNNDMRRLLTNGFTLQHFSCASSPGQAIWYTCIWQRSHRERDE